jgi:integrase
MPNDDRNILKRRGHIELSKYWPDKSRYRRAFPTITQAKQMRARIDAAIAMGTWRELKEDLALGSRRDLTIADFAQTYLVHVRTKNRRPDFHEIQLRNILPVLGHIRLRDFTRADAVRYRESRSRELSPATINRGVAVLRSLLTYAVESGHLSDHPLAYFRDYPEAARDLRVMTITEERSFLAALLKIDLAVGVYAGFMGETAIRTDEALRLSACHVDERSGIVTVPPHISKTKTARHIPMSDFCRDLLGMLPQVTGIPQLFIRLRTLKPVKDTRGAFSKAREATAMDWIFPEGFRHFRITQWMSRGVDPRTVQELAGHADIHTTMKYAHFAPSHAARSIVEAQREEAISLQQLMFVFPSGTGPKQDLSVMELERLYAIDSAK